MGGERVRVALREALADRSGQGTTEYAILVGVLVVNNTHLQQLSSI